MSIPTLVPDVDDSEEDSEWRLLTKLWEREYGNTLISSNKCKNIPFMLLNTSLNKFPETFSTIPSIWWENKAKWKILQWSNSFKLKGQDPERYNLMARPFQVRDWTRWPPVVLLMTLISKCCIASSYYQRNMHWEGTLVAWMFIKEECSLTKRVGSYNPGHEYGCHYAVRQNACQNKYCVLLAHDKEGNNNGSSEYHSWIQVS